VFAILGGGKSKGKRQSSKGKSEKWRAAPLSRRRQQNADLLIFALCLLPFDLA